MHPRAQPIGVAHAPRALRARSVGAPGQQRREAARRLRHHHAADGARAPRARVDERVAVGGQSGVAPQVQRLPHALRAVHGRAEAPRLARERAAHRTVHAVGSYEQLPAVHLAAPRLLRAVGHALGHARGRRSERERTRLEVDLIERQPVAALHARRVPLLERLQ